jgi:membrane protein implicated in regulation of membrane protease activity
MEAYIWFILALVLFILEIITPGFVILWFGIGALVAAGLQLLGVTSLPIQIVVFVAISTALVIASRTIFKRFFMRSSPGTGLKMNMDAFVGKIGIVTEVVDNENSTGRVVVDGQDWLASSADNAVIAPDAKVRVVAFEGAHLLVRSV